MGRSFRPGKLYKLVFVNRVESREFIFEFAGSENAGDNGVRILHRNKWACDGVVSVCNGIEGLVFVPCDEQIEFSRYENNIDWDNL